MCRVIHTMLVRIAIRLSICVISALLVFSSITAEAASIQITVNYSLDIVSGNTDPGANLVIQVRDSKEDLKAESHVAAEPDGSFFAGATDWVSGTKPDITVGDSVLVEVTGHSRLALIEPVGQISAIPDEDGDTVSGVINAPYTEPLPIRCMILAEGGPTVSVLVDPQGGGYSCDFGSTGWDLQKMDGIAVSYIQPDGNSVMAIAPWPRGLVNYGQDIVTASYSAGHTFSITVTDSSETIKAVATAFSHLQPVVSPNVVIYEGFEVSAGQWSPSVPDIIPGDIVSFIADDGYNNQITVGEITGDIDVLDDSIAGTINATDFASLPALDVHCIPWGAWNIGLDAPYKDSWVAPDGSVPYSCQWDPETEWDMLPEQRVDVGYVEPDYDWVDNSFIDPAPHLVMKGFYALGNGGEGGNLALEISVVNTGDATAEESQITLTLQNMTYLADTCGINPVITTVDEGQVDRWDLGELPAGDSFSCQIFVSVDGLASAKLNATALVETSNPDDQGEPSEKHREWFDDIKTNSVNLAISKHSWTPDPAPGTDFVWEVEVCNSGDTSSSQITLIDTFPASPIINFVNWWAADPGWQEAEVTSYLLSLTLPTIPNGSCRSTYLKFHLLDSGEVAFDTSIVNTAEASEPGGLGDAAFALDELFISEPRTNLTIQKDWQNGQLTPGGNLHYLIQFGNTGNIPFAGYQESDGDQVILAIVDTLPVSTSFVEARLVSNGVSSSLPPLKVNGGTVVFQIPGLENGYDGQLGIDARVSLDALPGTLLVNSAKICLFNTVTEECVTGAIPEDTSEDNESQSEQVIHENGANLRITKQHEWLPGQQELRYKIHFENVGNATIPDAEIRDTYPVGVSFSGEYETDSGQMISSFSHTSGQIIWNFKTLEPGQAGVIEYTVTLNDPIDVPKDYTNTVEIFPDEDVYPSDNISEDTAVRRDIGSIHIKLDEQAVLGTAISANTVTVVTPGGEFPTESSDCPAGHFSPDDIALGGCWIVDTNRVLPGDAVMVNTDLHSVNVVAPDPFEASASSFSNVVFGQIDNLDAEWVKIRIGLGSEIIDEAEVQTDNVGNYSADFANIPSTCWAEVLYKTAANYAEITFHRKVVCNEDTKGDINGDGNVDLRDVIIGLKVITGSTPAGIDMAGDVNDDSRIGIEEVLYELNVISK